MLTMIKGHLHKAQQKMKEQADQHRREVEFKEGDMVYLKMRSYRRATLAKRVNEKLAARFYGPYKVESRVGKVAYKLKLPSEAKIHPTFHVSQLKKAVGEQFLTMSIPTQLTEERVLAVEPERVLEQRFNTNTSQEEVLIK